MRRDTFRTGRLYTVHVTRIAPVLGFFGSKATKRAVCDQKCRLRPLGRSDKGLHPQSPRHFGWQPSARVLKTLRSPTSVTFSQKQTGLHA